ncbi:MAG: hydrogenase maturation peptidase HycI [Methanobrevibacter sp.]|uniref:hydrogenase maturation peptidase HycI n=1 Tax=Methanobrevibacter sp. TaxID=66852 RepID=UPI001B4703CE|nr:hydrogenase maturation peptidase HycI [Methanobrevibacter sp.]MBP3790749.1 hydrogenase maturation peptidase HycI [Methanobrevibacter sp.]
MSFESQLSNFLKDCEKLIVLGVGNELKSDDGVGPFIINKLKAENIENKNLLFIDAQTVPENFTGKIRKEKPTHLIIVDACLMDSDPGDMQIVNKYEFADIGISTHSMSLSFFVRYLEKDTDFRIIFVGIEPKTMDFGNAPTPKVQEAADKFIETLKGIIL